MKKSTNANERQLFSNRLKIALVENNIPPSPTRLAATFNAAFPGEGVTVHGVRKWLVAEAMPTQDKVRYLAAILQVSPTWLVFGDNESPIEKLEYSAQAIELVGYFNELGDAQKSAALAFVSRLAKR